MSCGRERNQRPGSDSSPATAQLVGQVRHIKTQHSSFVVHQTNVKNTLKSTFLKKQPIVGSMLPYMSNFWNNSVGNEYVNWSVSWSCVSRGEGLGSTDFCVRSGSIPLFLPLLMMIKDQLISKYIARILLNPSFYYLDSKDFIVHLKLAL